MTTKSPRTLITGTSRGIGRFLAEHYAELGHQVVGLSRQEADFSHPQYRHMQVDITDESQVLSVFKELHAVYGGLDHLINNAGIASMNLALLTPLKTVEQIFATNVFGTFLTCREAARLMKKERFGRIINLSTIAMSLALEGESVYAASKAAVVTMTEILAREFAPWNITVNALAPAPTDTNLIRNVPKDKIAEIINRQAIKRMGTMQDIANVTDFYLSPASSFITGQHLLLGGLS